MSIRACVPGALLVLALLPAPAAAQGADAQAPVRQVIVPAGATPNPNLSPGVRSRNVLYVSGQLPAAGAGADIRSQTLSALTSIKTIVEAGGSTMANVVKCTVFLTDIADYAAMNDAYRPYFPEPRPARSTFQIVSLAGASSKVEIECIAVVPER